MGGWLKGKWSKAENAPLRAIRRGDTDALNGLIENGHDIVALYHQACALVKEKTPNKNLRHSILFLEEYIQDIATVPGDHVPRHHDWRMSDRWDKKWKPKC